VPELQLHMWISSVKENMVAKIAINVDDVLRCPPNSFNEEFTADDDVQRNVAANLDSILSTRNTFSPTSVEDIFLRYEIILSYIRSNLADKRAKYKSIKVRDLYRGAFIGSEVPSILINAATPLDYYHGSLNELPPTVTHCAMLPRSLTTPGYDAVVRYPLASDSSKYFEMLEQTKFSFEDNTNTLQSKELVKNYDSMLEEMAKYNEAHRGTNRAGYTAIFNCWRNGGLTSAFESKLPTNCILLNKTYLERNLSSVIVNLLHTCDVQYSFDQKACRAGTNSKEIKE